jgi:hypothetical protein
VGALRAEVRRRGVRVGARLRVALDLQPGDDEAADADRDHAEHADETGLAVHRVRAAETMIVNAGPRVIPAWRSRMKAAPKSPKTAPDAPTVGDCGVTRIAPAEPARSETK